MAGHEIDINTLRKVIDIINNQSNLSLQSETYLRTYPAVLEAAKKPAPDSETYFCHVAVMAYGWMPRILRIDRRYVTSAANALMESHTICSIDQNISDIVFKITCCLHSVVGASKVLHFARPDLFPIWDSKVAAYWKLRGVDKVENYIEYSIQVNALCDHSDFVSFYNAFDQAYGERLARFDINPYSVSNVRAVEAAAFEMAGANTRKRKR